MKACTKCGALKSLAAFSLRGDGRGGHRSQCRACASARTRVWRRKNLAYDRAYKAAWKRANPEKNLEYFRRWAARYGRHKPDFSAGQGVPETT